MMIFKSKQILRMVPLDFIFRCENVFFSSGNFSRDRVYREQELYRKLYICTYVCVCMCV